MPTHPRPRHDRDLRAVWYRHIVIGGHRVRKDAEFERALAIGLQPDTRRAEAVIAETHGDGVAGGKEIFHHSDEERAAPRTNVTLKLPLRLQSRPVRCRDRGVALPLRIGELYG